MLWLYPRLDGSKGLMTGQGGIRREAGEYGGGSRVKEIIFVELTKYCNRIRDSLRIPVAPDDRMPPKWIQAL